MRPICAQDAPSWTPGGPSWAPSWGSGGDLGAKLGSKIDQKSIKNRIISWPCFLIDFGSIFGGSCVDFWWIFGPKLRAKLTKKSIIWPLVGKFAEIAKKLKKQLVFQGFLVPRPSNFEAKLIKKRPQTDQKSTKILVSILIQFLMHLGGQLGPKTLPKPSQNRSTIDEKWT